MNPSDNPRGHPIGEWSEERPENPDLPGSPAEGEDDAAHALVTLCGPLEELPTTVRPMVFGQRIQKIGRERAPAVGTP